MDIETNFYVWVTMIESDITDGQILDGYVFDGDHGFGVDSKREISGLLYAISSAGKFEIHGSVTLIHVSGRGILWSFDGGDLPQPPFLLTNNKRMSAPQSSAIILSPTREAEDIFTRDVDAYYPVVSENFLGILHHSEGQYHLNWSNDGDVRRITFEKLVFSDWETDAGIASVK